MPDETPAAFVLDYELEPADLLAVCAVNRRIRRDAMRWAAAAFAAAVVTAFVTVKAVTLNQDLASCTLVGRSAGHAPEVLVWSCGTGSPLQLAMTYARAFTADAVCLYVFAYFTLGAWRRAPRQAARRWWRVSKAGHGRYLDKVADGGVTEVAPDGTTTFIPWQAAASVRETGKLLEILGPSGEVRSWLPKRALTDPALAGALSEFVHRAIGALPPGAAAGAGQG